MYRSVLHEQDIFQFSFLHREKKQFDWCLFCSINPMPELSCPKRAIENIVLLLCDVKNMADSCD